MDEMNEKNDKIENILDIIGEDVDELTEPVEKEVKSAPRNDLEEYKKKIQKIKQLRYFRGIVIVVLVLIIVLIAKRMIDYRNYDSYDVLEMNEQIDSSVLHYQELGEYVLRYSGDGVAMLNKSDRTVWNDSIQMTNPVLTSFGEVAAIYEAKGTEVHIYGTDGKQGKIQTEHPILKANVSEIGSVAVILENGEYTLINYYAADGSLIASSSTNMRNPGYPADVTVSKDGMSMAVSYYVVDGNAVSSYLAFYNFGDTGKNKEDNLMDGFRFEGVLVPKIQYLNNNTLIAYREDGFSIFKGNSIIEEIKNVTFEKEIISSFSAGDMFGFVFSGSGTENTFQMRVYNESGNLLVESGFDMVYDRIKISDNQIILYNSGQLTIIAKNGVERFSGNFVEGNILDVVKRGMNRYAIACDKGIALIELD